MVGSKKLSYSYQTGIEDLDKNEARSTAGFTRYAKAKLGCEVPVTSYRGVWFARLNEEMKIQGWTWDDLITAVEYLVWRKIQIHKIEGVLHFVHEAQIWAKERASYDLHAKVAEAMAVETDEVWLRRLSLARGKALERVYDEWKVAKGEI
jgi:hypothetical protein